MHSNYTLTGELFIGNQRVLGNDGIFRAINPATGSILKPTFSGASDDQIDQAASLAHNAFDAYRLTTGEQRAIFLEKIAEGIEGLGQALLDCTSIETGLPLARLQGERARTTGQLRMFADVARSGLWQIPVFDSALPDRQPIRRSDLRTRLIPLGPVAMFGASNFPFAFSVAGGDTAAALAAGCPVVVKAHPSHPGTSELIAAVIQTAVKECGFPEGVFSMVTGIGNHVGERLVSHSAIQAVAFTGSRKGGTALCRIAQARPQPIPVYAEMSSINPVFLLPSALAARGVTIAKGLVDALTLGSGQFCTNPGLVFGIKGEKFELFCISLAAEVAVRPSGTMLNPSIHANYVSGVSTLSTIEGVEHIAAGQLSDSPCGAQANVFRVTAEVLKKVSELREEVFGPCSVIVECSDLNQMLELAEHLEGQLTATLQMDTDDAVAAQFLLPTLERKAGRLIVNGFPTGVEVSHSMVHGGPFPATSDSRGTSVGSRSLERFLRPVCYQDFPANLLPACLSDENSNTVLRIQDGVLISHSK
jgi:2,5-dioxopentanoate dehydrogenase